MRSRWVFVRRAVVFAALFSLIVLMIPVYVAAGDGAVTEGEARAAASTLIDSVAKVTIADPGAPGAEPGWKGARPGDPLLICDMEGCPSEYIVPVVNSAGRTVSIIGVGAEDGLWHWYTEYAEPEFPLIDAQAAAAEVTGFLRAIGIEQELCIPQARMASDKSIYWTFDLNRSGSLETLYLPVFQEGGVATNLNPPWTKTKQFDPVDLPGEVSGTGQNAPSVLPQSLSGGAPSSYDIQGVPYHAQATNYWCGPAALEMVFDYFGPDINQAEIASVADSNPSYGCYNTEILRASQFSSQSTSVQDSSLQGYTGRDYGYGAADANWSYSPLYETRYEDLKNLVSQNLPVLVLTYYDGSHSSGHFRVVKGYNDTLGTFIFHDPWYEGILSGPDVSINQNVFVDDYWNMSYKQGSKTQYLRWGMIACPLDVIVDKPASVKAGQVFTVEARVGYVGPEPLGGQYECIADTASATIHASLSGYTLLNGQTNQMVYGLEGTGSTGSTTWTVQSKKSQNTDNIYVDVEALISGSTTSYPSYQDWLGGSGTEAGQADTTSRAWAHDSIGVTVPNDTWYLAEGCTEGDFETWVLVQNPNDEAADVSLTYMTEDGEVEGPEVTIEANSRTTFFVGDTIETWSVSTKVESDKPVIAERSMYGNDRTWGHDSIGVTDPSDTWYLAEGCTNGGFETWVLVQNPNDSPAEVTLSYMTADGKKKGPTVELPANSRKTFYAADTVPDTWDVSTMVTSDMPVIAERAMYGNGRKWGHDSVGVSEPFDTWYLAEGCTNGGFETWVLVQNPNETPAEIQLTYMTETGPIEGPEVTLDPNSRQSFNVADTVPSSWEVSTSVASNSPVIAERAMYGNNRGWGHDSRGVSYADNTWYLAEGCTNTGFETWILVQNPNTVAVDVTLTFMTTGGAIDGPQVSLEPNTRHTFNVGNYVHDTWEVSTQVEGTMPVIAERAMYGDPL